MNFLSKDVPLVVYKNPINMHRSFNGLLTLAVTELNIDFKTDIYVLFVNRDRNQFKVLFMYSGDISIFTMRLSGSMKADFTKMDEINGDSFYKLVKTTISRKARFEDILKA